MGRDAFVRKHAAAATRLIINVYKSPIFPSRIRVNIIQKNKHYSFYVVNIRASCERLLLKTGGTSSGCYCGHAGFRWRSNWEASLSSPCSIFFHLPRHLNSSAPYDGVAERSSFLFWSPGCAAPPSGHLDSVSGVLIHLLSSCCLTPPSRSMNPSVAFFLACFPSLTHRCDHAGFPAWEEERHPCSHDCCGGDLLQSGLYFHWTDWITEAPL